MNNIIATLAFILDMIRKYLPLDENDLNTWFAIRNNLSSEWDNTKQ